MKRKLLCLFSVLLAVLNVVSLAAAAADTAGNVFLSDSAPVAQSVERDLYWTGGSRTFNGYKIGKSLLAAGWDITINNSSVGGSLRAGAYSIVMNGVEVEDNINAAAMELKLSDVETSGAYLYGNAVNFSGSADYLLISAGNVTLDGKISGNAEIYGNRVVLGDHLRVEGTLTVHSDKKPNVPSGAQIGTLNFVESKSSGKIGTNPFKLPVQTSPTKAPVQAVPTKAPVKTDPTTAPAQTNPTAVPAKTGTTTDNVPVQTDTTADNVPTQTGTVTDNASVQADTTTDNAPAQSEVTTEAAPAEKPADSRVKDILFGVLGALLLGTVIYLLLGGKELRRSGMMLKERTIPMLCTGFASLFVVPGVLLILLLSGFGGRSAGLLAMLFVMVCIYCVTYTGVSLANTLLPRIAKIRVLKNSWVCSMIGALLFWLLRQIPGFGIVLMIFSIIYTMGYFLQTIYLRMKAEKRR